VKINHLNPYVSLATVLALAIASAHACASADKPPSESSTFSFFFENDLFGNTDQQYTNGVQISWESLDLTRYADPARVPSWLLPIVESLPWVNEPDTLCNVGFSIGQKMFTPNDTQSSSLVTNDRPYAGWLYAGLTFTSKRPNRMDRFEFQLGVLGPAAQGEETQNFVHELRDLTKTKGWSHQLDNEPGLALIYERKWRILKSTNSHGFGHDVITHAGAAIGNVFVYGNGARKPTLVGIYPVISELLIFGPAATVMHPQHSTIHACAMSGRMERTCSLR
jgi:lipid A 3-O-deacylase